MSKYQFIKPGTVPVPVLWRRELQVTDYLALANGIYPSATLAIIKRIAPKVLGIRC